MGRELGRLSRHRRLARAHQGPARLGAPIQADAGPPAAGEEGVSDQQEHVLGTDGQFHVEDEAVDLSRFAFEDWVAFALFWVMAAVVFYQVVTRYVMDDPAGWTEEIARYFLVAVVFVGATMSVRRNNHIQVDYFYRLMPAAMGRVLSTAVDAMRW